VAAAYFALPILVAGIGYLWWEDALYSTKDPCLVWRAAYCILFGFWGLAIRAFHLRGYEASTWPEYYTLYPFIVFLNGLAIFTVLSLFTDKLGPLFFTGAIPLAVVFGLYSHPDIWMLSQLITKWSKKG